MAMPLNFFVKNYLSNGGQTAAEFTFAKCGSEFGHALARGTAQDPIHSRIPEAYSQGGFSAKKDGQEESLVRYIGNPDSEALYLGRYRQILENCQLVVTEETDPARSGRMLLRVARP